MDELQEALGGKRKYKENPLAAKAETGSLKIKIIRKNEGLQNASILGSGLGGGLDGYAMSGVPRSPSKASQPPVSPPKPRANRKHVPIFYQRPNAFDLSASTSTDESFSQTQSVTSDYEQNLNASGTSTSSTTTRFARLDIAPGLPGSAQDPMPLTNPLFTRGMSETSGSLTDLLKTVLPSVPPLESTGSYSDYSNGLGSTSEPLTSSLTNLLNPAAALRQLASSSSAYASHTKEPTQLPCLHVRQTFQRYQDEADHHTEYHNGYHKEQQHDPPVSSERQQDEEEEEPTYHFDAMSALQDAVKIAVASSSPPSGSSVHGRWPSDHDDHDLGPPPSGPPGFSIQHSLMGGGIEAQPVIPTINTVNFNWNRYHQEHGTQSRSSSIPTTTSEETSDSNNKSRAALLS